MNRSFKFLMLRTYEFLGALMLAYVAALALGRGPAVATLSAAAVVGVFAAVVFGSYFGKTFLAPASLIVFALAGFLVLAGYLTAATVTFFVFGSLVELFLIFLALVYGHGEWPVLAIVSVVAAQLGGVSWLLRQTTPQPVFILGALFGLIYTAVRFVPGR